MSRYTFIQDDEQFGKVTFEFRATSLPMMLDRMRDFLAASGFALECTDTLDLVDITEAAHHDVVDLGDI